MLVSDFLVRLSDDEYCKSQLDRLEQRLKYPKVHELTIEVPSMVDPQ